MSPWSLPVRRRRSRVERRVRLAISPRITITAPAWREQKQILRPIKKEDGHYIGRTLNPAINFFLFISSRPDRSVRNYAPSHARTHARTVRALQPRYAIRHGLPPDGDDDEGDYDDESCRLVLHLPPGDRVTCMMSCADSSAPSNLDDSGGWQGPLVHVLHVDSFHDDIGSV